MKRSRLIRLLLIVFCFLVWVGICTAQQVTLLHVNDTHSHIDAWGPKDANLDGTLGGLPKVATVVGMQRAADPQALFVHGGDLFHGDPFFNQYFGIPEIQILQQLGLNAMAVGNHEFQYGPDFLAFVLSYSMPTYPAPPSFPLVSSNLDFANYPYLPWIGSTTLKEVNGVKVGFFGITTPYDVIEQPAPVVVRETLAEDSAAAVAQLRSQGAQIVVCLCHTGMQVSELLAQVVPGIDVIVNAHDHVALAEPKMVVSPTGTTIIVSAGQYYRWVGKLRLNYDGTHVSMVDYSLLSVDENVPAYPSLQAVVDSLKPEIVARYGDIYHTQIAWATAPISKEFDPDHIKRDTALGDLVADAYRNHTGTEIALEASGFINEDMPPGPIVGADVFRVMSYGIPHMTQTGLSIDLFRLATFRISGAELIKGLEITLTNTDLYPQISGMRFEMDSRNPPYQRILLDTVHINGHKLDPTRLYSVTGTEGLVMFLPMMGLEVQDVHILPDTAYDAIKALVIQRAILDPAYSGRIRDVASIPGKAQK
ncbi:MAG TPA: bifunctional UDP-sugar hydrolase/5'-nucleotidase [Terriglobales bacterium]|nr:bifunctional UDP-sugar hydrolase/5'-nucleotidase [Terriglobales bacterium]